MNNKITIEFAASICYAALPLNQKQRTRSAVVRQFNAIAERTRARTEHGRAVADHYNERQNGEKP